MNNFSRWAVLQILFLGFIMLFPLFGKAQDCCNEARDAAVEAETANTRTQNNATRIDRISAELSTTKSRSITNENQIVKINGEILDQDSAIQVIYNNLGIMSDSLEKSSDSLLATKKRIQETQDNVTITDAHLNRFWIMIAAILVFFMQAGFKAFEVGMVRGIHWDAVGLKNLIDWMALCLVFYVFGFGFMFGETFRGLIGTSLFLPDSESMASVNPAYHLEFFLFQLAFAATAATIVSGAMSERTHLRSYLAIAVLIGLVIYPIFGHWAWGNLFTNSGENTPWLAKLRFHDFAGSTVVHSIGAWVALAGVMILGPRTNRFNPKKKDDFKPSNLAYSALGVLILWMGWWGFNGGSTLAYGDNVSFVILNTNLSAAAAGIVAYFMAMERDRTNSYVKLMGGLLGGLVAITACCDVVNPIGAIAIGAIAGVIHNLGFDLLIKLKLDDPVGAIPVHGFCGAWGTLAVGIFTREEAFLDPELFLNKTQFEVLGVQLLGIVVAFVFAFGMGYLLISLVDRLFGLRINVRAEEDGGNYLDPGNAASPSQTPLN